MSILQYVYFGTVYIFGMCLQTRNQILKPYWIATEINHVSGTRRGGNIFGHPKPN